MNKTSDALKALAEKAIELHLKTAKSEPGNGVLLNNTMQTISLFKDTYGGLPKSGVE